MNNLEFIVTEECELLEFLFLKLKELNKKKVKSFLSNNMVIVDNKIVTQYNYLLKKKQKVIIDRYGGISFLEKNNIELIYEDSEILIINKPGGLLSIATKEEKESTAYKIMTAYVRLSNQRNRLFILHRLDRDTSGIMVFSKNEKARNNLQDNWDKLVLERGYVAIVGGLLNKKEDTIVSYLKEDKNFMVYSTNDIKNGQKAITSYKVIKELNNYSLLKVIIKTGRKNQIRVHMYDIGHPIVGDKKYGSKVNPIKRLGLHAYKLVFIHPTNKKKMEFETDLPDRFISLFK